MAVLHQLLPKHTLLAASGSAQLCWLGRFLPVGRAAENSRISLGRESDLGLGEMAGQRAPFGPQGLTGFSAPDT